MCVLGCDALLVPPANAYAFCARASGCGLSIDREAQNMTVSTDVELMFGRKMMICRPGKLVKFQKSLANLELAWQT